MTECPECGFIAKRECALGSHRYFKHGVPGATYPPINVKTGCDFEVFIDDVWPARCDGGWLVNIVLGVIAFIVGMVLGGAIVFCACQIQAGR